MLVFVIIFFKKEAAFVVSIIYDPSLLREAVIMKMSYSIRLYILAFPV